MLLSQGLALTFENTARPGISEESFPEICIKFGDIDSFWNGHVEFYLQERVFSLLGLFCLVLFHNVDPLPISDCGSRGRTRGPEKSIGFSDVEHLKQLMRVASSLGEKSHGFRTTISGTFSCRYL